MLPFRSADADEKSLRLDCEAFFVPRHMLWVREIEDLQPRAGRSFWSMNVCNWLPSACGDLLERVFEVESPFPFFFAHVSRRWPAVVRPNRRRPHTFAGYPGVVSRRRAVAVSAWSFVFACSVHRSVSPSGSSCALASAVAVEDLLFDVGVYVELAASGRHTRSTCALVDRVCACDIQLGRCSLNLLQ